MTGLTLPRSSNSTLPGRHVEVASVSGWLTRRLNPAAFVQVMLVVCLALAIWPASYGGRFSMTIVAGNSMEPTLMLGDAVVTWREPVDLGDDILYRVPEGEFGEGNPVIHRVIGGDRTGWITQGDNSHKEDQWKPASSDVLGVAKFYFPLGGRVLAVMKSWLFIAFLGGVAAALLLWPDSEEEEEPAPKKGRHRAVT